MEFFDYLGALSTVFDMLIFITTLSSCRLVYIDAVLELKLFPFPPGVVHVVFSGVLILITDLFLILTHKAVFALFVSHLEFDFL